MLSGLHETFTRRLGLEPHHGRLLFLMGALAATLLCAYTIAKVLRDALFLAEFGALSLPYVYIGVALFATGFVWLEGRVARRFRRVGATRFNQYVAIGFSIAAAVAITRESHWTIVLFYLWTGSQAMMLLPHFWVLALDVWDSRRARRVFPLLTGFGLIGGLLGGGFAGWAAPRLQSAGLMWTLSGLLVVGHLLTRLVESYRKRHPETVVVLPSRVSRLEIFRRSAYIKVLAVGLALSVVVATLVDFQFKSYIQQLYPDPHALTQFLGKFYVGLNALALLFQFGISGWLLQRMGLGASTGLQPTSVMLFASLTALSTGWWGVIAMRWTQGVVFQTLGKSSAEIYYAAIHPRERRVIKTAIDTIVERWTDAAVGMLLIVGLHVLRVNAVVIAIATALLAAIWLIVLLRLNHHYGFAFEQALSSRWIGPELSPEVIRTPSARKALLKAMREGDERRIVLALQLSEQAGGSEIVPAVLASLTHPAPAVRAAAVRAMEARRLPDPEGVIEHFLDEPHEGLRRAAIGYLLSRNQDSAAIARRLIDGEDPTLRQYLLDALFEHPYKARSILTMSWIDAHLESGTREGLQLAARALGGIPGSVSVERLRSLLRHPDVEIQRTALLSAARRPDPKFLGDVLPLLFRPELHFEARQGVAEIGNPAVASLVRLLDGEKGARAQTLVASTLAQIATPRAIRALTTQARSNDGRVRHLGLRGITRARGLLGPPAIPRPLAHRLFLRELADYRACVGPGAALQKHPAPEVRLLAESYLESAEKALERAFLALACYYDPKPLFGAFNRLKSGNRDVAAPALEHLGNVLPRKVFQPASKIFEDEEVDQTEGDSGENRLGQWIRGAWESDDEWLRACAVRALSYAPDLDPHLFEAVDEKSPLVREELEALAGGLDRTARWFLGPRPTSPESSPC